MAEAARVLVVDDDPDIRMLVLGALRVMGYVGTEVPSGVEALRHLEGDARPDLVLLDVQMPGMDGWSTLRAIRANESLGDLAVVMCSVKGRPQDHLAGWGLGCDGYVAKPFDIRDLAEVLGVVLARTPEERREHRAEQTARVAAGMDVNVVGGHR